MSSLTRWAGRAALVGAVALALVTAHAGDAQAQQKTDKNVGYVTVALAKNPNEAGRVKAFANGKAVVLMDRSNLTPEALGSLLGAYMTVQRQGNVAGKDAMIRSRSAPRALSKRVRTHYIGIIDKLLKSDERVVPGVGKVQAVDVPMVGAR